MLIKDSNHLVLQVARSGLKKKKGNFMLPGNNGPYNDRETPVRNTSHWLIIFSKAYEITKIEKFKKIIFQFAQYLSSSEALPYKQSFFCRQTKNKDKCNGLIGQAWVIEALMEAGKVLKKRKYTDLAIRIFLKHKFNQNLGLWHRLEINGKNLSIDPTLNHQIWFASSAASIKNKKVQERIGVFLDKLEGNITILDQGVIFHPIVKIWRRQTYFSQLKKSMLNKNSEEETRKKMIYKSIGYHSFNLYALAILKKQFPQHSIWSSVKIKKALQYCFSQQYEKDTTNNKYGYPYNPIGFEMSLIYETFSIENKKDSIPWLKKQLKQNFKTTKQGITTTKTSDKLTLIARVYELTRSTNLKLDQCI